MRNDPVTRENILTGVFPEEDRVPADLVSI
jgi:hypothetical protein